MLDLNEHEGNMASVVDPMGCAERDVDGISTPHIDAFAVKGHDPLSTNHEPMLGPARMPLVAQTLSWLNLDRLHLEVLGFGENGVGAPRAVGMLNHPAILPDHYQDSHIRRPKGE